MAKKSVTPSIRMDEEEYRKIKALKEQYGVSWNELIKCVNTLLGNGMTKSEDNSHDK